MPNLVDVNSLKQKLLINLYKIQTLDNFMIFLCDKYPITFLGDDYEFLPSTISGIGTAEGAEEVRPTWNIANPSNFLNSIALSDSLEGSQVTHYQAHIDPANTLTYDILSVNIWQIYQIPSITKELVIQLRTLTDIPAARIPPRGHYPPEFPHTSI